jgi:hypothetical protein
MESSRGHVSVLFEHHRELPTTGSRSPTQRDHYLHQIRTAICKGMPTGFLQDITRTRRLRPCSASATGLPVVAGPNRRRPYGDRAENVGTWSSKVWQARSRDTALAHCMASVAARAALVIRRRVCDRVTGSYAWQQAIARNLASAMASPHYSLAGRHQTEPLRLSVRHIVLQARHRLCRIRSDSRQAHATLDRNGMK